VAVGGVEPVLRKVNGWMVGDVVGYAAWRLTVPV
jgi:hypothetical protein